jgi:hypothetical protein
MEPPRRSIARRLVWASIALLWTASLARVAWVFEKRRRIRETSELMYRSQRAATELHLAWLAAEAERERAERAVRRLRRGGREPSWLCERVPCTDFPLIRPEEMTPRLLRTPTLAGDGPRPREHR